MKKSIYRSVGLALAVTVLAGGLVGCKSKTDKEASASASKPSTIVVTTDTFLKPEDGMDEGSLVKGVDGDLFFRFPNGLNPHDHI